MGERGKAGLCSHAAPEELGRLESQLVDAEDPAEAEHIREWITRGFYGIAEPAEIE